METEKQKVEDSILQQIINKLSSTLAASGDFNSEFLEKITILLTSGTDPTEILETLKQK